ncbi:g3602 [Coccomyxa elongata]
MAVARPPEVFLGAGEYTPATDMWSVGCILAELLLQEPLFPAQSEEEQLSCIVQAMGTPTEDNCPGCSQLPLYREHLDIIGSHHEKDLWKDSGLPQDATDLLRKLHPFFTGVEQVPPPFALNTPAKAEVVRPQDHKRKCSIDGCEADQNSPSLKRDSVDAKRECPGQEGQNGVSPVVALFMASQSSLGQSPYVVDLTDSPVPAQLPAQAKEPQPPLPSEVWPPLPSSPPPALPAVTQPAPPAGRPAVPPAQLPAGRTSVPPPRPPPGSPVIAAAAPAQGPAHLGRFATRSVAGATWPVMGWHHPGYMVAGQQLHYAPAWDPHNGTAAQMAYHHSAVYGPPLYIYPPTAPFHGPQAAGWAYMQPL